jgi:hypothetical protein
MVLAATIGVLAGGSVLAAVPANAAANHLVADWEMNEGSGATVMNDSSGNGINGSIGSAVQTGFHADGATGYHWAFTSPTQPPPKPERLILVNDSRLNPGTGDYAVTMRFRTKKTFGNIIQKGQAGASGGYFKWEIPHGVLKCVFRGVVNGQFKRKELNSPTALNDNHWHTVRCERVGTTVKMTIDGSTTVQSNGATGSISNTVPLTIAGKSNCDQQSVTCDYFTGDIDWVKIETG